SFGVLNYGSRIGGFAAINGRDLVPTLGSGMSLDTVWSTSVLTLIARGQILFHGDSAGGLSRGIFRVFGDAVGRTRITSEFSLTGHGQPRWSPDYQWVTYGGNVSTGNNYLHIATPNGATVYHVVNDVTTRRARFSPGGMHIAAECGAAYGDVCVVTGVASPSDGQGDGAGKVLVTQSVNPLLGGPGVFAWNPTNPDQLAVVRDTTVNSQPTSAIYTVNYDGTGVTRRAVLPEGYTVVGTMDWSPDGTLLAFGTEGPSFTFNMYTLAVGSGTLTAISSNDDQQPVFSPDGSEILFVNGLSNCTANYFAMAPNGSGRRQLTNDDMCDFTVSDLGHDWSPDGAWIVLAAVNFPPPSGSNPGAIFIVPATVNPSTYATQRILVRGGLVTDIQPSWRP
ncbi:MAG TPA: hypothetical protein VD793_05820, partial [Gemmatimonadales bacterium]|nr:hypothetical protein [Gemmatimonadales bacterium]